MDHRMRTLNTWTKEHSTSWTPHKDQNRKDHEEDHGGNHFWNHDGDHGGDHCRKDHDDGTNGW